MSDYSDELSFALELARLGGRLALGHYGRDPQTKKKPDGTWVTEADWAVEAQIRLRIARTFPEHNILGEEEGLTGAGGNDPTPGAPTWVIDPIDGTNNYIAGIPIWATLVALRIDDTNVVGVAHAPALRETYEGAIGLGARANGATIKVDPIEKLDEATFLYADGNGFRQAGFTNFFETVTRRVWRTRGFGDFWGHMLVARGAAHAMAEPVLSIWDVAALEPIITEAGGKFTHLDGSPWRDTGSALTTCGPIHDQIVELAR